MKKSKFLPTILGVAALASSVALPYNTFADSKTAEVKITVAESLSLTLSDNAINFDLSDTAFHSGSLTVTGATNSARGYTISFGTNNDYNDLRHSNILVEDKIESVTEDKTEANFPATAWGVSTDAETFKQVPMAATNIFSTENKGENDHTLTVGAKAAAGMVAGDYSNELMFTIVANPDPEPEYLLMQDIADWKDTLELEQQIQVKDARDGKIYWVSKLKDGNIWMTQNLDYDLSVAENQTLTPATSNVTTTRTVTPVSWGEDNNSIYYLDGGDNYFANGITQTAGLSSLPTDDTNRHYAQGDYYSWKAATAGQGTISITAEQDVNESICPAGWRLPTSNSADANYSFGNLIKQYGYSGSNQYSGVTDATLLASPLFFARGGNVYSGSLGYQGSYGFSWSSRAFSFSGYAYYLYFDSSYVVPSDYGYRGSGFSVRCVAL